MYATQLVGFACFLVHIALSSASEYAYVEFGRSSDDREHLDTLSNALFIPEPALQYSSSDIGALTGWRFYARRTGDIVFQIWRQKGLHLHYELIGQSAYRVTKTGQQAVEATPFQILRGDVIGFYTPGEAIIPYDEGRWAGRTVLYVQSPNQAKVTVGSTFTFTPLEGSSSASHRRYSLNAVIGEVFGNEALPREHIDTQPSSIFIVDSHRPFHTGVVDGWQFYAQRPGIVYMQVWRNIGVELGYELIGQTECKVHKEGVQTVFSEPIETRAGDLMGLYFPGNSLVTYDLTVCNNTRAFYVHKPPEESVTVGAKFQFRRTIAGLKPCRVYSVGSVFVLGSWFGKDILNQGHSEVSGALYITEPGRKVAHRGLVNAWQFYVHRPAKVTLQVFRPQPGKHRYKLVGQTVTEAKTVGLRNIVLRKTIAVDKGDVIGVHFPNVYSIPFDGEVCRPGATPILYASNPIITMGGTYTFREVHPGSPSCRTYAIRALIEAMPGVTG